MTLVDTWRLRAHAQPRPMAPQRLRLDALWIVIGAGAILVIALGSTCRQGRPWMCLAVPASLGHPSA